MPTFKIHGQVYHLMGTLMPDSNTIPSVLQIYFMGNSEVEYISVLKLAKGEARRARVS